MQLESLVIPLVLNTAGILGAGAIIKGIVDATSGAVKSTMELANSFDDLSDKLGISVENAARWVSTSKTVGLSTDQLSKGMNFLTKNIAGNDKVFSKYNITLRNNDGTLRKTEDIVQDVAREYNKLPDGVEKTNMAMELFGSRIGPEMHDWLQRIESQAQYTREQLVLMGIVIEEDVTANWEQFGFSVNFLNQQLTGLGVVFSNKLQPALMDFVDWMSKILQSEDFLRWWDTVTTKIGEFATGFVNAIQAVSDYLGTFEGLDLGQAFSKVVIDSKILWENTLKPALIKMLKDGIAYAESGQLTNDINLLIASIINAIGNASAFSGLEITGTTGSLIANGIIDAPIDGSIMQLGIRLVKGIIDGVKEADWKSLSIVIGAQLNELTKDMTLMDYAKIIGGLLAYNVVTGFFTGGGLSSAIAFLLSGLGFQILKLIGWDWMPMFFKSFFPVMKTAFMDGWSAGGLKQALISVLSQLSMAVSGFLKVSLGAVFLRVQGWFFGLLEWIQLTFGPALSRVFTVVGNVLGGALLGLLAGLAIVFFADWFIRNVGSFIKALQGTFNAFSIWFKQWGELGPQKATENLVRNLLKVWLGYYRDIVVNGGKSINDLIGLINKGILAINRALGVIGIQIPTIPYLGWAQSAIPNQGQWGSGLASGGIATGGMTLVGERGPELVNLPAGSKVYNANASASKQQTEMQALIQELRDSRIDYNAFARVLRDQLVLVGG